MGTERETFVDRREGETLVNVVIGVVVGTVASMVLPIGAQFAAGGISGYLQRGSLGSVAMVGAVAGFLSALPGVLLAGLVVVPMFLLPLLGAGAGGDGGFLLMGGFSLVVLLFVAVVGLVSVAVVGALGGVIGGMLADS
jgi:hypothetical protein